MIYSDAETFSTVIFLVKWMSIEKSTGTQLSQCLFPLRNIDAYRQGGGGWERC